MNDFLKTKKFHIALGFIPVALGVFGFFYLVIFWSEIKYNYLFFLLVLLIIFLGFAYIVSWTNKRVEDLKKNGQLVKGKILYISLELTAGLKGGRGHFYKLVCTIPSLSGGDKDLFVSDTFQFKPDVKPGSDIDIYLDRNKPKENYWIDMTKVPVETSLTFFKVIENLGITDLGKSSGFYRSYDGINFEKIPDNSN